MKNLVLFFFQIALGVVVAVGFLVGSVATILVIVLLIVRFKEAGFYPPDRQILAKALVWLAVSCLVTTGAWWLYRRCFGQDNSLKFGEESSPRVERLSFAVFDILAVCLLSFWLWSIIVPSGWLKIFIIFTCLLAGFVGMHLRIFFHELGHLIAAHIVGFAPRRLHIGTGPVIMLRHFKTGFWIEWRVLPRGGFAVATPPGNAAFRSRWSILISAGPVTDALILFVGYRVITACYGTIGHSFLKADGAVAAALFFWCLWTALSGVLPIKGWAAGRRFSTDGYLLLRLWTASNRMLSDWASIPDWRKALDLFQSIDGCRNAARNADSPNLGSSALPAENLQILEGQRNRLASQLLRECRKGSPST